ncbi:MAG: LysE family transporter [Candidatus Kapabacteria bacterium]|nr:LysE family transporter [Ignavibacteriota bacterium]MCW5884936.1 LysE family transporter [Candidatus Kapabacteria bacterium]
MVTAIIVGAVIGFILAMPPGPIAMANIRLGLEKSRKDCAEFAIGTASMDMIYCIVAIFAASAIHSAVDSYLVENPIVSIAFQSIIVAGLIYFGFTQFRANRVSEIEFQENPQVSSSKFIQNLKNKGPLFLGVALALTNLANPTFVPSLTIMSAWVHKIGLFPNSFNENIIFSIGFGLGNFLWLYVLSLIVIRNRHKLSNSSILRIKQFAGVTFIGFGGFIGYRLFMFTNWAQIFKYALIF